MTDTDALGQRLRPASDLTFLPYLAGERTPHNNASIRGAFIGLGHQHDRRQMTQAVLEGVAYALRDNLGAMASAGTQIDRVVAVGGGAASQYWLRLISTVLDLPVDVPASSELGAAFGAARLAIIASNECCVADVCTAAAVEKTFEPDHELSAGFSAGYDQFTGLYPALQTGPKLSA